VDPQQAVARYVSWGGNTMRVGEQSIPVDPAGSVVAIAVGKAAVPMARGLAGILGDRIVRAIALTKDGHSEDPPDGWSIFEASHPVPDDRGTTATRAILDAVAGLSARDLVIVLVSGGGSALLESPKPPLALGDIQETTRLLLRAGAPIQDLNAVRSELSEVKGGGLRRAIGEATCVSLILSDVLGNDPSVIASGPTIARVPDPERALAIVDKYGISETVPHAVRKVLATSATVASLASFSRDAYAVIADNDLFVDEVARLAARDGYRVGVKMRLAEGEASVLACQFLNVVDGTPQDFDVVLGGGEATVTVRGDGIGGRNTEFALAAAQQLAMTGTDLVVASLASDGQDGSIDAAGAIVDRETIARGRATGLDAAAYLLNNDSGTFLEATGDLLVPGPTGTNVNDVYIAVRVAQVDLP
jgi:hydroxypyruvate reductase